MIKFENYFDDCLNPRWNYIKELPEFKAMKGCYHSEYWHREGDPFEHTVLVVKNMIELLKDNDIIEKYDIDTWHKEALLMAALYHDVAKPVVTIFDEKKQDWSAPNHSEVGSAMTRKILYNWYDVEQREYIVGLIRNHMILHHILEQDDKKKYKKLFRFITYDKTNIRYIHQCFLCMCDDFGSLCKDISVAEMIKKHERIYDVEHISLDGNVPAATMPIRVLYNAKRELYDPDYLTDMEDPDLDVPIYVYVLIGLPGSGKSSWSSKIVPELPVVSRDIARSELGYCEEGEKYLGTKDEENQVTKYVEDKMLEFASQGKSFVIDNTHLRQKYRDRIHQVLKNYNVYYVYVYIEAPTLEENIERRESDGFGERSKSIIENMLMTFEFPYRYEYDELIIYKQ